MGDQSLIGDGKTVIEMIISMTVFPFFHHQLDQIPKLIGDHFDWPSNAHGKVRL